MKVAFVDNLCTASQLESWKPRRHEARFIFLDSPELSYNQINTTAISASHVLLESNKEASFCHAAYVSLSVDGML